MNNIEILEQIIKYFERNEMVFDKKYKEAIENLIKENKELKEKVNVLNQEKEYLNTIIDSDNDNYIPKSKLKEKIEELNKRKQDLLQLPVDCARTLGLEDCDEKIILYKELLEGE